MLWLPAASDTVSGVTPRALPSIVTGEPIGSDVTVTEPESEVTAAALPLNIQKAISPPWANTTRARSASDTLRQPKRLATTGGGSTVFDGLGSCSDRNSELSSRPSAGDRFAS